MNRMDSTLTTSRPAVPGIAPARSDIIGGLVSSAVAIPLAMAFGMFAFVTLGDEYFAYGAMAGLVSAVTAGLVCVLLGDRCVLMTAQPGKIKRVIDIPFAHPRDVMALGASTEFGALKLDIWRVLEEEVNRARAEMER